MWIDFFYSGFDYWTQYHKVTFDGENRLIRINYGETSLDVTNDIYSDWKEWISLRDNMKYAFAISTNGGESIAQRQFVGATYFLVNGWRIKPWEGNHSFTINGKLYTREENDDPYVTTDGQWKINVINKVSSLVFTVETSTGTSSSVSIDPQDIARAVWQYSVTGSLPEQTFGDHTYRKILTLAQYMATK